MRRTVSSILAMIGAPIAGAIFVLALPLVGLGYFLVALARSTTRAMARGGAAVLATPAPRPGWEFLGGGRPPCQRAGQATQPRDPKITKETP